jgi:hypothetical protein
MVVIPGPGKPKPAWAATREAAAVEPDDDAAATNASLRLVCACDHDLCSCASVPSCVRRK